MRRKVVIAIGHLSGGGAERVATVWANELTEAEIDVSFLTCFRSDNEYYVSNNIHISSVAGTKKEYLSLSFWERFCTIRSILKAECPEYVISFLPTMQIWVMFAALGLPTKRIETIRNNPWEISIKSVLNRALWKACYCTGERIILQSSDQAPFFSKKQQAKSVVIPNPLSDVYRDNYRDCYISMPKHFIAVGRIIEQKNYPMMIKAFANACKRDPELTLNIYGVGDKKYEEYIRTLIATEGMTQNIFLMGRVNHIECEYSKYDVFLMSSDYEGMPNALAEAMASRLICISTDCKTGPRDLIQDRDSGFLVPVGDADVFQSCIEDVMKMSPDKLNKMASKARDKVLTYCSKDNSLSRLCDLLR